MSTYRAPIKLHLFMETNRSNCRRYVPDQTKSPPNTVSRPAQCPDPLKPAPRLQADISFPPCSLPTNFSSGQSSALDICLYSSLQKVSACSKPSASTACFSKRCPALLPPRTTTRCRWNQLLVHLLPPFWHQVPNIAPSPSRGTQDSASPL